jgi:hypothetical protein
VRRWYLLLMVLVLAGCGQPMQIGTPTQTQVHSPQPPDNTAQPSVTAINMPSALPSALVTPDLDATPIAAATAEPTAASTPTVEVTITATVPFTATQIPAVIVVPATQPPATSEERWRAQEQDRKVNDPPRIYTVKSPATLWWYDPLTSQSLTIGTISGEFPVQAEFILRSTQQAALEVPYRINNDFGLTAISEAVRERMKAAGYSQSVEAYILRTADTQPK